jgi:tetratricopeptide (TPR) repeat protein
MTHLALAIVLGLAGAPGQSPDKGWPVGARDGAVEADAETDVVPAPRALPRATTTGVVFAQVVPGRARDAYRRALKELRKGKADDAAAHLREAVGRFRGYFDANLALGVVEGAAGRFAESESAFAATVRVNPRYAKAHLFRAEALVGLADGDAARRAECLSEAARELDLAWELGCGAPVYLQRARVLVRLGDRGAAADALDEYLRLAPNIPNAAAIRAAAARLRV